MVAKGGCSRRDDTREKDDARQDDSSDEDDEDGVDSDEEEGPPLSFVLAGDDTGSGIDYNVLDEDSWQRLEEYCKQWGIKQAHLESIYSRFARTIVRTEHLDFTLKPQFHASLDFLADEFMTTAGEFAAQFFIQTWFLRRKRGLKPPKDRRCVDFARLVIMCCDLTRLGDYELLANFWACVMHRFSGVLPNGSVNLDTKLNIEFVKEIITLLHTDMDKKLSLLLAMLLDESQPIDSHLGDTKDGTGSTIASTTNTTSSSGKRFEKRQARARKGATKIAESSSSSISGSKDAAQEGPEVDDEGSEARQPEQVRRRYLTLRSVLRFSLQHPPLMFPVVQFQRVLRSKIIGSRYWLRRRKPASDRGVSIRSSLALSDAYRDVFDRVSGRGQAWVVASGHLLLHALNPPPIAVTARAAVDSDSSRSGRSTGSRGGGKSQGGDGDGGDDGVQEGSGGVRYSEQCRQLLDNCLPPPWYNAAGDKPTSSRAIGEVAGKMAPALKLALTRLGVGAKSTTRAPVSRSMSELSNAASFGASNGDTGENIKSTPAPTGPEQLDDPQSLVAKLEIRTEENSGTTSGSSPAGRRSERSRNRTRGPAATAPCRSSPSSSPAPGAPYTKTCAICLRRTSPVAMCRKCGRRASKAFKDAQGSRQARVILVPYGAHFGVGEPDALEGEGDSVKRWVRLYDDESGADFYYNVYYDSSVWKSGVELPRPAQVVRTGRRRDKGGRGGGGTIIVGSPKSTSSVPGRTASPPGSPMALPSAAAGAAGLAPGNPAAHSFVEGGTTSFPRSLTSRMTGLAAASGSGAGLTALRKTKTAFSAASMAALQAAGGTFASGTMANSGIGNNASAAAPAGPIIKPAMKPPASPTSPPASPKTTAAAFASRSAGASPSRGNRVVVVLSPGDTSPEVVLDAHKRIYPPFRLVSREDAEAAAGSMATGRAREMEGVTPGKGHGFTRTRSSRGGSTF